MPQCDVAVIDYGVGNLLSVSRGFEHCGANVLVTSDVDAILSAPRVVLPGVGAFANGMGQLQASGLVDVVRKVARRDTPLLGICLGMQMLLDSSEEFGGSTGLGIIPGRVIAVPAITKQGTPQKIPHIGWSSLVPTGTGAMGGTDATTASWHGTLLEGTERGAAVYFVHSFMAEPTDETDRVADCLYGGVPVSAAIARGNTFGCQFHPEKSGEVGLTILRRFLAR